jgi:type IV pilus assembly protein PilX
MEPRYQHLSRQPQGQHQRGVALIIALVLLVIMTLLGLSAMRTVSLEERMTGQTFDRSLSFQSAEAALREAESWTETNKPTPAAGAACNSDGVCGSPAAGTAERWKDSGFSGWKTATAVVSGPNTISPQYFIEYLGNTFPCVPNDLTQGNDCKRYRITARSNAGTDRASVMLQSIYATE